jgi:Tfp pilus assembly protein PilN
MNVNLLPIRRRVIRARRRAMWRWIMIGSGWCACLSAGYAAAAGAWPRPDAEPVEREAHELKAETQRLTDEIAGLEKTISAHSHSLSIAKATIDHPDWSVLLAQVIEHRPEGMRFRRWLLGRSGNAVTDPLVLRIEGEAPDLGALTEFVLRLESLRVFRRVTLGSARNRGEAGGGEVGFTVDGELLPGVTK